MIKTANLYKSFDGKAILKNVSGTFHKGQTNFIIGASGTGKSVLLKCIVGLHQPDAGQVFFADHDFYGAKKQTQIRIRRQIGMLFQGSALFDSKTVEENVMFPLDMQTAMDLEEKRARVNFCLKCVGLENINHLMPSELSGGMKKRVGIARAIVMNSEYLFCDEPNSGLDPISSSRIDNLIREITQEFNMTTIVVSHDLNSILQVADNIMFIHEGQVFWQGQGQDLLQTDIKPLNDFVFSSKLIRKIRAS